MLIIPVVYNSGIRLNPNPPSWPATNWDDKDYDGAVRGPTAVMKIKKMMVKKMMELVTKTWSSTGSILCLPGPCAARSGGRVSCEPFWLQKLYQIKSSVNDHLGYHVTGMYVLVEGFLDQILRFKAGESGDPLVQEDQLQVQSCPEHYLCHQNLLARQTTWTWRRYCASWSRWWRKGGGSAPLLQNPRLEVMCWQMKWWIENS